MNEPIWIVASDAMFGFSTGCVEAICGTEESAAAALAELQLEPQIRDTNFWIEER